MTTPRLTWQPAGPFGRRAGEYFIGRVVSAENERFVLSFGDKRLGDFGKYDQAKEAAEAHAKGGSNANE